jgi:hypothetical protein
MEIAGLSPLCYFTMVGIKSLTAVDKVNFKAVSRNCTLGWDRRNVPHGSSLGYYCTMLGALNSIAATPWPDVGRKFRIKTENLSG